MRHSMAWPLKLIFADGVVKPFARGNANLRFNQIHAGDQLRDRMLHLNARIHLDEIDRAVFIHQKFHGAGVGVADLLERLDHFRAQFLALFRVHRRRRRFLHQFLVAALDAAFPLAQVNDFAVLVAEHLKFDVPRVLDKFLRVHVGIAKGLLRFAAGRLVGSRASSSCLRTMRMPRPPPPAEAFKISG